MYQDKKEKPIKENDKFRNIEYKRILKEEGIRTI